MSIPSLFSHCMILGNNISSAWFEVDIGLDWANIINGSFACNLSKGMYCVVLRGSRWCFSPRNTGKQPCHFFKTARCNKLPPNLPPPETNIAPKNEWLEYYFPIGEAHFQGRTVSFSEGIPCRSAQKSPRHLPDLHLLPLLPPLLLHQTLCPTWYEHLTLFLYKILNVAIDNPWAIQMCYCFWNNHVK